MNVTESPSPFKFAGFGAMNVAKPYEFIRFGVMDVAKPYIFVDFVTDRRPSLTSRTIAGSPEGPKYLMLRSAGVCEINAARMNLPSLVSWETLYPVLPI